MLKNTGIELQIHQANEKQEPAAPTNKKQDNLD
jgi:hypothetical protein